MKPSSRLCFLVLVISSVSRGQTPTVPPDTEDVSSVQEQNETMISNENGNYDTNQTGTHRPSTSQQTLNETETETMSPTPPGPTPSASTSPIPPKVTMPDGDKKSTRGKKEVTTVSTTTEAVRVASSKAGYVVLVLIIIIIIILCVILYMLRRASRTYSFDLHGPGPSCHQDEPIGTFGQVYLDDLNQPAPKDIEATEDLTPTPVANGTSPEPLEKKSSEENVAPGDPPETNDVQNSPSRSFSSSSDDDRVEETSNKLSSSNLFNAPEEQNENNNNNPSVGSSCPFVEINLDEPAWCDQLLASLPPSSSSSSSS